MADKVATAAQFLTLRLTPFGSTHMGCYDSDGPGHAPRYLDVSRLTMNKMQIIGVGGLLAIVVGGFFIYAVVDANRVGYVMDGGKYNKTKYTRKDNPREFKRITDSLMMFGIVAVLAGGATAVICLGGSKKTG